MPMTLDNERIDRVLKSAQKHVDESKKIEAEMTSEPSKLRLLGRVALAAGGLGLAGGFGVLGAAVIFEGARAFPEAPFMAAFLAMPPILCAAYLGISSWELGKKSITSLKTRLTGK